MGTSTTLHSLFVHPGRCWGMDPTPPQLGKWDPLPGGRCCLSSPCLKNCRLFFPV